MACGWPPNATLRHLNAIDATHDGAVGQATTGLSKVGPA